MKSPACDAEQWRKSNVSFGGLSSKIMKRIYSVPKKVTAKLKNNNANLFGKAKEKALAEIKNEKK